MISCSLKSLNKNMAPIFSSDELEGFEKLASQFSSKLLNKIHNDAESDMMALKKEAQLQAKNNNRSWCGIEKKI
jgi:hypothetical protein